MKQQDLDAIGQVLEQALASHKAVLHSLVEQRTAQCIDADRAVELARDLVDQAEQRLTEFLQRQTSEAVLALREAAAAELARGQDLLAQRLRTADAVAQELANLRERLQAAEPPRDAFKLACEEGFEGSRSAWLASLRGADGQNGKDGKDALAPVPEEIARALAADEQLRELLRGPPGQEGARGDDGKDGTTPSARDVALALAADDALREQLRGPSGKDGAHGAGVDAPLWAPGIYREGAVVQAYLGQFYRALRDTSAEPYGSDDWARVGTCGFHLAQPWAEERRYRQGDLVSRDFSTFLVDAAGELVLFAARGPKGETGKAGTRGDDGRNGRDGAELDTFELRGGVLALVMRQADGQLQAHTLDLVPLLEQMGELLEERLFERLVNHFGGQPPIGGQS